jgi:hypothetical protein
MSAQQVSAVAALAAVVISLVNVGLSICRSTTRRQNRSTRTVETEP